MSVDSQERKKQAVIGYLNKQEIYKQEGDLAAVSHKLEELGALISPD